jgi:hypothetical protein
VIEKMMMSTLSPTMSTPKTMQAACLRAPVSHFETVIHLNLRRSPSLRGGVIDCRSRSPHRGIEKTKMSTVMGMLMMMPLLFGVGGYVLVSRRP